MAVKHRCFVSYHKVNSTVVKNFVEEFSDVFTAKTVGVTDEDDFIDSDDREYVMRRIREKYLSNTTVTIVLIGECTKARKYVDWEIASDCKTHRRPRRFPGVRRGTLLRHRRIGPIGLQSRHSRGIYPT